MQLASVMLVENQQPSAVVFTNKSAMGDVQIEWGAKGHPDGTDLQEVPEHVAHDPNFRRALNRGVFRVVEASESTLNQITGSGRLWQQKQQEAADALALQTVHESKNDIIVVPCIGPGLHGQTCGADVMVKEAVVNDQPNLCPQHRGLAGQYVPRESDEMAQSATAPVSWSRASMTAPNQIGN